LRYACISEDAWCDFCSPTQWGALIAGEKGVSFSSLAEEMNGEENELMNAFLSERSGPVFLSLLSTTTGARMEVFSSPFGFTLLLSSYWKVFGKKGLILVENV